MEPPSHPNISTVDIENEEKTQTESHVESLLMTENCSSAAISDAISEELTSPIMDASNNNKFSRLGWGHGLLAQIPYTPPKPVEITTHVSKSSRVALIKQEYNKVSREKTCELVAEMLADRLMKKVTHLYMKHVSIIDIISLSPLF